MRSCRFVVERDPETGLLAGCVPGWPGAHTQGADMDELQQNLLEVIEMLPEDGQPALESGPSTCEPSRSPGLGRPVITTALAEKMSAFMTVDYPHAVTRKGSS
jgi:predicted RNase H-like HicB family nuclease